MQTKKDDIRQKVIEVAQHEFIKKGYDDTSMRVIAKKANTTVGNLYHYFSSKEELLDIILEPSIADLDILIKEHLSEHMVIESKEELMMVLDSDFLDDYHIQYLLRKELIILFEIKYGKYKLYRDHFMEVFQQHIAWHLGLQNKNDYFVKIICQSVVECIITVLRASNNYDQAKKDFIRFFKIIANGIIFQKEN